MRIVTVTLHNVGKGGLYDREMGGFFRYSTVRDWSIPHFEKMSEDNAKWLQLYLHAYQLTEDSFYASKARGIIEYVNTWLSDLQNGCFITSLGYPLTEQPTAYICVDRVCTPPIVEPKQIPDEISRLVTNQVRR